MFCDKVHFNLRLLINIAVPTFYHATCLNGQCTVGFLSVRRDVGHCGDQYNYYFNPLFCQGSKNTPRSPARFRTNWQYFLIKSQSFALLQLSPGTGRSKSQIPAQSRNAPQIATMGARHLADSFRIDCYRIFYNTIFVVGRLKNRSV